ncbi:MAG: OsmC family protein [Acidobacteria bacterium]|nr:OsmC family protein [Acidobacteriota bacterium]MDW7984530.1 OsmC family protein [Acidobacteriota bacterium]
MEAMQAHVTLRQIDAYRFEVRLDRPAEWTTEMDEPAPLGKEVGPNAARMLAAAVGHCLSASLFFCLQKARVSVENIETDVTATIRRNERGRWRVAALDVRVQAHGVAPEQAEAFERCVGIFEDYCIVTASVRQGIPVTVQVQRV